jgi:ribonuclease HII
MKTSQPLLARFKEDDKKEMGCDEAGRGCFTGPIMAGAIMLPPEAAWTEKQRTIFLQLRDSKKIAPKKRERLFDELKECLPTCAVGTVHVEEINERGIQWANREAFRRAIRGVRERLEVDGVEVKDDDVRLLVDGTLAIDDWKGEQELVVEGDNQYIAIAGASILAKVTHDRWIRQLAEEHPEWNERYDLAGSKGYGTARHREGIRLYGGCEQHRELFIQRWLPNAGSGPVRRVTRIKKENAASGEKPQTTCLIRF